MMEYLIKSFEGFARALIFIQLKACCLFVKDLFAVTLLESDVRRIVICLCKPLPICRMQSIFNFILRVCGFSYKDIMISSMNQVLAYYTCI